MQSKQAWRYYQVHAIDVFFYIFQVKQWRHGSGHTQKTTLLNLVSENIVWYLQA